MAMRLSISIDVPNLDDGVRFYCEAFELAERARPVDGVAVLAADDANVVLLEKAPGTQPAPNCDDQRRYERHWTPVHADFHVDDLDAALDRVRQAGGVCEALHRHPDHGGAAFCSDPFGHGFCLIES